MRSSSWSVFDALLPASKRSYFTNQYQLRDIAQHQNRPAHTHFIESLPKNSNSISLLSDPSLLGSNFKCSTRKEQQPTVSASSSVSFSPPTRSANRSITHIAVAICRVSKLLLLRFFL
ncbi:hypothetical protein HJC23_004422 [Cyclotella cryptica]|uniref:Uncharacterized protein n=1 Tax=Cyclotella cryptica TaxID=29204 RepID=A0ABD3QFW2_9STRA